MNPSERACFVECGACTRCSDKGRFAKCSSCAGRHDPEHKRDPYDIDDRCRCTEGVLQYRLQNGRLIIAKYHTNPFEGKFITESPSQDEQDWDSYVDDGRELRGDEAWDPVQFNDGASTADWMRKNREGAVQ